LTARFALGRLLQTPGVQASVPAPALAAALERHVAGDFGELCPEDRAANERAIADDARVLSSYRFNDVEFWIITEADRSCTTALLPSEY
jgi:hypothetical protein